MDRIDSKTARVWSPTAFVLRALGVLLATPFLVSLLTYLCLIADRGLFGREWDFPDLRVRWSVGMVKWLGASWLTGVELAPYSDPNHRER